MKALLVFLIGTMSIAMTACRAGKGCPTNGRNVGAERVLSGDAKTMKAIKKAKKFKA
jgi:hypothetical protein